MNWRQGAIDVALLALLKGALGAWVLHTGFTHVSDDDYARVVIAELFAHAPKLDPSGTSWLPVPFWVVGSTMIAMGRSLATARALAFVGGLMSVVPVYLALRAVRVARWRAFAGAALGMATPWNAWLGVATVPEAPVGGLIAAGAIAIGAPTARSWVAVGLLLAALSRYEAWPVCAVCACAWGWSAISAPRSPGARATARRDSWCAALAAAGPLAWMAWNAHAHDGPFHFLRRVAAFRNAAALVDPGMMLATFPRALVSGAPEVMLLASAGLLGLVEADLRRRWALPLVAVAALLGFLVYGDWRGGAPTHHPERALVAAWWVLGAFGVDAVAALARRLVWGRLKREAWAAAGATAVLLAWSLTMPSRLAAAPGMSDDERRDEQLARGRDLAARHVLAFDVAPCAFEHFALFAAFGAPERARVTSGHVPGQPCPTILAEQAQTPAPP